MEKDVRDFLNDVIKEFAIMFTEQIESDLKYLKIQSPIEQIFWIEWQKRLITEHYVFEDRYCLKPQFEIKEGNRIIYILDFVISQIRDLNGRPMERQPLYIAIELDSFAYHEKTREQFEYEKKRDRYLEYKNWKVFRFSGSEIVRDVRKCVGEIYEYLMRLECDQIEKEVKKIGKKKIPRSTDK